MPTITPIAYNNTGTPIPGTTQFGDLAVGTTAQDYGSFPSGFRFWATPDQDLGYVVAKPIAAGNQPNPLSIPAYVGFNRTSSLTEASFVSMVNSITGNSFVTGSAAKTWLEANGYWTSYVDTWSYDNTTNLSWPASSAGYTLYSGSFTSPDDGYTSSPITSIDSFQMNNQTASNSLYVSTNGYITIFSGSGAIIGTPQDLPNPAAICANPGDNWLQPGLTNTDGDVQNLYYLTGGVTGRSFIKFLVYGGTYGAPTAPTSWILNLYIDSQYQWIETRAKSTLRGDAGPYNLTPVFQPASTTSKVWRGDLNGLNWTYMGTGRII